jgi:hypothetical protein
MLCDICGKTLGSANVLLVPPSVIVKSTQKGYVPSKLPPSWKPQCEALGISIASHWRTVVDGNASVDWGLCQSCKREVDHFEPRGAAGSSGPGKRFCTRFSKEIEIVQGKESLFCDASLSTQSNPKPCAERCIHNIMLATAAREMAKLLGVPVDLPDYAPARVSAPVREHSFEVKKELIPRPATPTRRCPNCDAVLYGALVSRCYKCHTDLAEVKTDKSASAVSVRFWQARGKGYAPSSKETTLETKRWWQFWK